MSRISFDEEVETHLNEIMNRLKSMGIKNVSRPAALKFIIQMNKSVSMKVRRQPKNKFGFIFR